LEKEMNMSTLVMKSRMTRKGKKRTPVVKVELPKLKEEGSNTGEGKPSSDHGATMRFFWLWFGIPFLVLLVVAWLAGHS
jgi:hypothetical protein